MNSLTLQVYPRSISWLFTAGVVLLAFHPTLWLIRSWLDPAYQSFGFLVVGLVTGLMLWSLGSSRRQPSKTARRRALWLLALTAVVRLLGQLLGIQVIGALALVVDVYALGLLWGLAERRRALSPGWLAILFAFSLPLERILQRILGFALQQLSAAGACSVLSLGPAPVHCEGVRILLAGQDVLVDLPCAGTRGLVLLLILFAALASVTRPTFKGAVVGLLITIMAVYAANVVRIVILALGLAFPAALGSISVMAPPWHEAIGLLTLTLGAVPILLWSRYTPTISTLPVGFFTHRKKYPGENLFPVSLPKSMPPWLGLVFPLCAVVIIALPARPVDVARAMEPIALPLSIAGLSARYGTLSQQENRYFVRYGGSASRVHYGPYGLLLVTTSAPLRHLHAPDECLTGSGHRVRYLGRHYGSLPTALYRSTDPNGRHWRIAVSFISENGATAASVGEAVWHWLQRPGTAWTMVQRIAPWETSQTALHTWDQAVIRALDWPVQVPFHPFTEETPL